MAHGTNLFHVIQAHHFCRLYYLCHVAWVNEHVNETVFWILVIFLPHKYGCWNSYSWALLIEVCGLSNTIDNLLEDFHASKCKTSWRFYLH